MTTDVTGMRVLLADDTRALVPPLAGCDLVVRGSAREAVASARSNPPAAVVVHAGLPPEGGVSLLTRLAPLQLPCVLVTDPDADAGVDLAAALRAGARAVVDLSVSAERLKGAVAAAVRGELFLGGDVRACLPSLPIGVDSDPHPFPQLSEREREVLARLAAGCRVDVLASRMGLSEKTVRNQLSLIQAKLGVDDRAGAAQLARRAGLGRT